MAEPPIDQEGLDFLITYLGGKVSRQDAIALIAKAREDALKVREFKHMPSGVAIHGVQTIYNRRLIVMRSKHPQINEVLKDIHSKRFLDLGCCMGTDLRRIVAAGGSTVNVFGVEYQQEFLDLGFRIFNDRNKLGSCFVEANLLQEQQARELIKHAKGDQPWDVVYYGSVLHLFTEELIEYLIHFARSFLRDGGVIMGQTVASTSPVTAPRLDGGLRFLHSPESLATVLQHCGYTDVRIEWRKKPEGDHWGTMTFYATKKLIF